MTLLSRLFILNNKQKILTSQNFTKIKTFACKTFTSQPKNRLTPILSICAINQIRHKSIFKIFKKADGKKLKIKDNIPDEFSLIYRNTMETYLLLSQFISSICAGITGFLVLTNDMDSYHIQFSNWKEQPKTIANEMYVYLLTLVGVCVLLQAMVMKMPLRIYKLAKDDRYTFIFYGNLPFTRKRVVCKLNEIVKLPETGILPWKESRYEIRNTRGIILLENFFRRPADLDIMLGRIEEDDE